MSDIQLKKVIIAEHYGFCMGVKRAISTTEQTMKVCDKVTILNEIVHNDSVVKKFARAGVGQSKSIGDIEDGTVIISAHGASPEIIKKASKRGLEIVDATCPLVIHIHKIIKKLAQDGYHILHFGDPEHDETIGIVGHAPDKVIVLQNIEALDKLTLKSNKVALTAQTTAYMIEFKKLENEIRKRFPQVEVFNTICDATNQRQEAITALAPKVDMMLIVGSSTSANSKRLAQISEMMCGQSFLINSANEIKSSWFVDQKKKIRIVGLSAGASTPDFLIEGAINRLKEIAGGKIEVVSPTKDSMHNSLTWLNKS